MSSCAIHYASSCRTSRGNVLILFFLHSYVNGNLPAVLTVPGPYNFRVQLFVIVGVTQFLRLNPTNDDRLPRTDHRAQLEMGEPRCGYQVIDLPPGGFGSEQESRDFVRPAHKVLRKFIIIFRHASIPPLIDDLRFLLSVLAVIEITAFRRIRQIAAMEMIGNGSNGVGKSASVSNAIDLDGNVRNREAFPRRSKSIEGVLEA